MQLCVCQYGIWNYNGRSRICLVSVTAYQPGCVYRSISVCAGFIFKWWNFYYYDCGDCIFDEQQADLYSLTFVDEFKKMGKRLLYMIHTMTDETYAVNLSLTETGKEKEDMMFVIAFLSRCYWMAGTIAGGVLGQLIPIKLEGIDFCMTALFVIIFIDNWEKTRIMYRPF